MIPVTSSREPNWLPQVLEGLRHDGCAVVEGVIDEAALERYRSALYGSLERFTREVGEERLVAAGEVGVVRIPMLWDEAFFDLLATPEMLAIVDGTVSDTAVLHLQNGFVLPPRPDLDRPAEFQSTFHMDFPRVLNGYLMSINVLVTLDRFTAENGGTLIAPATHQSAKRPDGEFLERSKIAVETPPGSLIAFDSTIWHAAGVNRSSRDRLAVNHQFTRSYVKQQIDYVRALGDEVVMAQEPRVQQLLGWYTRVVTGIDEYYRPASERLYRAGQG